MSVLPTQLPTILPAPTKGIRALARLGFLSIGLVYLVLGALAVLAAAGVRGGATADQQQAFQTILRLPLGQALLGVVALGLAGYVVWRFTQALLDTEGKGSAAGGLAQRGFYIFSGLLYAGLAWAAAKLAWYGHQIRETSATKPLLREALQHEAGQWALGLVGAGIVVAGLVQIYRALTGKFAGDLNSSRLSQSQRQLVYRTGQVGYTARGVVLLIIGYYCARAAQYASASQLRDTEGTLDSLHAMGPGALGVVAVGLVAYGFYMLVQARFPVLRGV